MSSPFSARYVSGEITPIASFHDEETSSEAYRQLFVSLELDPSTQPVIGVVSAISGEGCSTVALGLARTLAQDLDSVVSLVDVDLEHPSLAALFNLEGTPGLCDVLEGTRHLSDVSTMVAPNLCIVPAGTPRSTTANLLRKLAVNDPFRASRGLGGPVILDLPPLLDHAYSSVAAQAADAVVLVVRAGVTPVSTVREAIARLEENPPRGIVLNAVRSSGPSWVPRWLRGFGRPR